MSDGEEYGTRVPGGSEGELELKQIQTHMAQKPFVGRSGCAFGAQKVRVRWGGLGGRGCRVALVCVLSLGETTIRADKECRGVSAKATKGAVKSNRENSPERRRSNSENGGCKNGNILI